MTQQSSAAYWTRPEHRRPTPEPCWRRDCTNDAATVQDERFRGRYCAGCLEILPTLVMEDECHV